MATDPGKQISFFLLSLLEGLVGNPGTIGGRSGNRRRLHHGLSIWHQVAREGSRIGDQGRRTALAITTATRWEYCSGETIPCVRPKGAEMVPKVRPVDMSRV